MERNRDTYDNRVYAMRDGDTAAVVTTSPNGHDGDERSYKDEEREKSWWKVLSKAFPNAVGVAGIKFVFNGKEMKIRRVIWCVFLVTALAIMTTQIIYLSVAYSKSPVTTRMDIEYADYLDFPSVVICNYNSFRKSYLEENEKEFADYLTHVANLAARGQPYDYTSYKGNLTNTNLTNLSLNAAHQRDSIRLATFNNEVMSKDNFSMSLFEFGVCFTFNLDTSYRLKVHSPGISYGLQVILDARQWDYFYSTSEFYSAGFQIQAFDSGTSSPRVNEYGIAVGPGTRTLVGLTVLETYNLPPPYGNCGETKLKYYDDYRVSSCRIECQTDFVVKTCDCRAPYMPGPGRECSPSEILCIRDAVARFNRISAENCTCPIPCYTVRYATSVSQAKFPADFYSELLAREISHGINGTTVDPDYFNNNLCLINIFFNELSKQKTTQQQAYLFFSLLSDIGGCLGMWIGGSILTVVEVLDIMGYSLHRTRAP